MATNDHLKAFYMGSQCFETGEKFQTLVLTANKITPDAYIPFGTQMQVCMCVDCTDNNLSKIILEKFNAVITVKN